MSAGEAAKLCDWGGCADAATKLLRYGYDFARDVFTAGEDGPEKHAARTASLCHLHAAELLRRRPEAREVGWDQR